MLNLKYQYLVDATTAVSMFVSLFLFMILFEPRFSRKRYLASLIPFMTVWLGVNLYILVAYGLGVQGKYTLLTATLPSLIYFFIVSKNRGGRFFFTFCLCDTVMMWMMMVSGLIDYAVGSEGIVNFILRMLAFPVMLYLARRYAQKPYLALLHTVSRGWWLFAAMTGLFYVTMSIMGGVPTNLRLRPEDMPAAVLVLALLPLTYITIFMLIRQQDKLYKAQERQRVFETQAVMMEHRVEDMHRTEDAMRLERHDMRHQLQTIVSLSQQGDTQALLDYVGAAQDRLNAIGSRTYCANPILNAVLVNTAEQAQALGISLEMSIALPDELPVDAMELSIVFANALENAIRAVQKLPREQRRVICKSVTQPQFMVEISNPYVGEITFDREGLPISSKPGHGIGTRSIVAFAEKYNALCLLRAENGWFKVQIAV